jgi:hypothetical protein
MTDTTEQPTPTQATLYHAFHVRDREGAKGVWTRIGTAWPHNDGKGLNVQLDCLPIDGRVSLRTPTDFK